MKFWSESNKDKNISSGSNSRAFQEVVEGAAVVPSDTNTRSIPEDIAKSLKDTPAPVAYSGLDLIAILELLDRRVASLEHDLWLLGPRLITNS